MCCLPQQYMSSHVRRTNTKVIHRDIITLMWTGVDPLIPSSSIVTWQVGHQDNGFFDPVWFTFLKRIVWIKLHLSYPLAFSPPQRTGHGRWSSTITQNWPPSMRLLRQNSTLSTSTTRLGSSSWRPSSASQITANNSCPTTAGSPASSTRQARWSAFNLLFNTHF